jgi:hypothetical protein
MFGKCKYGHHNVLDTEQWRGASRVRVAFGVSFTGTRTSSRYISRCSYCSQLCSTIGSGIRATAPACHQRKPSQICERGRRRGNTYYCRTCILDRGLHSDRLFFLSHPSHEFGLQTHLLIPLPSHPLTSRNLSLYLTKRMDVSALGGTCTSVW